jgi:DNA mismatch repair ATPase MutS
VDNSIEINSERVVLITGANMAGKSTFLRAVGVNMVLAYAGSPVCAEHFSTGNYRLYSSMRTADSLKDDESYFFAEIKRLKKIVEMMQEGTRMLILLDEVLKGTNTTDKQKGSVGLIKKSIGHEVLCFIATHDLSLGEMQEEHRGKIVNYCFESYIRDLALTFDYKMRPGLAKNMNASFLMKQMGIMD